MQTTEKKKSSATERIVITGVGLLTPVGASCRDTAAAILHGRSAYTVHETVQVLNSPSGDVLRGATISRIADDLIAAQMTG
ncbi:MAG TPA: hypothetical protein P5249_08895, partial [Smithellaceae bacterium]|nr:hypothetical protein [Smithellaceae bacterium]